MADDKIALEIFIEADKANLSLGELEQGFDAMKEQLKGVGRGSEEFKKLSSSMANTTAEIKNIELGFEGLDKEQVASELGGLAGGIGDVTASLVLMGGENETMQQMAASIEKALAISMGMKGAIEGMAAANKLYTNLIKAGTLQTKLQTLATKAGAIAMKFFNAVLRANPIALLVTALVAAGAALLIFAKNTSKASKEAKMFSDIRKEAAKSIVNETTKLQILLEVAKDETVAKGKRQEAIEELNRISPEYLSNLSLENVNTAEGARLTDLYVESLIKASEAKAINAKIDAISTQILEDQNKEMGTGEALNTAVTALFWGQSEAVSNLNENRADHIQTLKDERKALMDKVVEMTKEGEVAIGVAGQKSNAEIEAEKLAAKLAKEKAERDKKSSDKRTAQREKDKAANEKAAADAKLLAEKEAADAIALEIDKNKLLEDLEAKAIEDKTTRSLAELEIAQERERAQLIEKYGLDTELMLALETEQLLQMNTLIEGIEQEARDKKIAADLAEAELKKTAKDKELQDIQDIADAKKAQRDKDFANATATIGALSALNKAATDTALLNAAGDEEKKEKIRKASFEREKKLNIAMALINGAQAVLAGFATGGLPMAIVAGVTAAAQLAAIVATTYQGGGGSVKEVDKTAPVEPDGAGAGGAGAQINAVTNTSTILGNQQVFVTETDITDTQNNVSVIEESATF